MVSYHAIKKILGIDIDVDLEPKDMARRMRVTFFPGRNNVSENILYFEKKLRETFRNYNITIISYDDAWDTVPLIKRLKRAVKYTINNVLWLIRRLIRLPDQNFLIPLTSIVQLSSRKRFKRDLAIICLGEQATDKLPMQYITSFKTNSIITVLDFPHGITENSTFDEHFDKSMSMFAYHMTNIIIATDHEKWMLYNFNASHPIYRFDDNHFDEHILRALVPKVVAPINPHRLTEFKIVRDGFSVDDNMHKQIIDEMSNAANLFGITKLYPSSKKIDGLPFRHNFHKLIGKMHLDNRSGMSFGYLAFQMPTKVQTMIRFSEFLNARGREITTQEDMLFDRNGNMYLKVTICDLEYIVPISDVWVMTLRSGSNKTDFNRRKDLIKLGLVNGRMYMSLPIGLKVDRDYKPSFDTKVILAHAIGNTIVASMINFFYPDHRFVSTLINNGIGISHWHGYINRSKIPVGIQVYGNNNLHVSCSSPQSAIYALHGKLERVIDLLNNKNAGDYKGDVHIEPHHGININYRSLSELASMIINDPEMTQLGNKYLQTT